MIAEVTLEITFNAMFSMHPLCMGFKVVLSRCLVHAAKTVECHIFMYNSVNMSHQIAFHFGLVATQMTLKSYVFMFGLNVVFQFVTVLGLEIEKMTTKSYFLMFSLNVIFQFVSPHGFVITDTTIKSDIFMFGNWFKYEGLKCT